MDSFEWNKVIGAVLLTGLCAMTASMVGNILVPPKHAVTDAAKTTGPATKAPEKAAPETPEKAAPKTSLAQLLTEATAEQGQKVSKKCTACHTFTKGGANRVGPNLWNLLGRDIASVDGYAYSSALKEKQGKWDYETVARFLGNPKGFAKGTKMTYRLRKPEQQAQILVYLRSLSDSPIPLPKAPEKTESKE